MDLEEWEFLPRNDGFVDLDVDGARQIVHSGNRNSNPKNVFDMDYFIHPSQDPQRTVQPSSSTRGSRNAPTQLVQVPISWEPIVGDKSMEGTDPEKETAMLPIDVAVLNSAKNKNSDQDRVSSSQVSFKKMKENEFVDMKMESPRSGSSLPQINTSSFTIDESFETKIESPGKRDTSPIGLGDKKEEDWEESNGKLNLWKLSLHGVGAICSFGVAAAATICIIFFGSNHKNKNQDKSNKRLRFQIYTDDKRIKEVVQRAAKLKEAISAASVVSVNGAHISFGGSYDGR